MQVWFPDDLHMFGRGLTQRGGKAIFDLSPAEVLTDVAEQMDVRFNPHIGHAICRTGAESPASTGSLPTRSPMHGHSLGHARP